MQRKLLSLCVCTLICRAAVPTPREHLGFTPGDDYKLADTTQIFGYFQKLAAASDRIRLVEFGKSSLGKPMYIAFISAPENLKTLDRWREISRRLALGEPAEAEARALAEEGKAIVWIDSGLHASEVAPAQHAPELAWRMVTGEDAETRAIRRNVILLQIPVINPDGLDLVAHWYLQNVGTPYEAGAAAVALSEVRRTRQQSRLVHAEPARDAQRDATAVPGVVPADRLQPAPVAAVPGAHLRPALCRAAESEHPGAR